MSQVQSNDLTNKVQNLEKAALTLSEQGQINQAEQILKSDEYLKLVSDENKMEQQIDSSLSRLGLRVLSLSVGSLTAYGGIYYFAKSCFDYSKGKQKPTENNF